MLPKYTDVELPLLGELVRRGGSCAPGDPDAQVCVVKVIDVEFADSDQGI
jgi:hypothetical protein